MAAASPRDPEEAFARMILEAHGEAIRRYLDQHGVLPNDLEDVLQDVVRTASKLRAVYDPERPAWPWLRGIARNVLMHDERRRARSRLLPGDHTEAMIDVRPGPEDILIQRDRLFMLAQMLGSLSDVQRRVLIQYKIDEMPMPAVAEAEGLSLDSAWMHCKNAEDRCRAWFHRWQAAERARGRDGEPIVLLPLFDGMESDAPGSRFAGLARRAGTRAAVALLALGCMSPASSATLKLEPMVRLDVVALNTATPSEPAAEPLPASPAGLATARGEDAKPARALGARDATADEDDDLEDMVLQAEVELNVGHHAQALRLLMDHSDRSGGGKSEAKRNKLLREIAGK